MRNTRPTVTFDCGALYVARKQAGLTQRMLADKLDVTTRTIQYWEQGAIQPFGPNVVRLAELFGLTPEHFYIVEPVAA